MILENGIKIYDRLLKKCVEYVNKGWDMKYRREDVVGIEIDTTFIFVHFKNKVGYRFSILRFQFVRERYALL